jgi:hypothetical protein
LLARKGAASPVGFAEVRPISLVGPFLALRSIVRRADRRSLRPLAIAAAALAVSWLVMWQLTRGPHVEDSAAVAAAPASPVASPLAGVPEIGIAEADVSGPPGAAGTPPETRPRPSPPPRAPASISAPSWAPSSAVAAAPADSVPAKSVVAKSEPAKSEAAKSEAAKSERAAPPAAGRKAGYRVQLFALRSEVSAKQAWANLKSKYKGLFQGLRPNVVRVRLGVSGEWIYRLQAGEFPNRRAARKLCKLARNKKLDCIVVRS